MAERIGEAIRAIPAKTVARVAGVTPKAVERWRSGDNAPTAEALIRLCAELDEVWAVVREGACRDLSDAERKLDQLAALLNRRGDA